MGAELCDSVDKSLLKVAVNDVMPAFPLFKTRLKRGYGGYYLQENLNEVDVFDKDDAILCPINVKKTHGFQFRLSAEGNKIYLEMFHALTDANGAIVFLRAIIRRYRELQGVEFEKNSTAYSHLRQVKDGDVKDSFRENYRKKGFKFSLKSIAGKLPHRIGGKASKKGFVIKEYHLKTGEVVGAAKKFGVTVTAFLAGAVAFAIKSQGGIKRDIVMMIPVNLRRLFPDDGDGTLSNFVTFVRVIIKRHEGETIEECMKICSEQIIENASKDKMQAFISTTVKVQRNIFFRMVPLCVKWIFIRLGRLFMKSRQTVIISNVGRVDADESLKTKSFFIFMNASKNNLQNVGIVSHLSETKVNFTSATEDLSMPLAVEKILKEYDINTQNSDLIYAKRKVKTLNMQENDKLK